MSELGGNLRFYFRRAGGHVHVRVFSGKSKELTHGKNGDLVFSVEEWPAMSAKFASIAEVLPDKDLGELRQRAAVSHV